MQKIINTLSIFVHSTLFFYTNAHIVHNVTHEEVAILSEH